jgi:hypothetical protein
MDGKVIAIQQPEHLPWLGFFDKMAKSDYFVYLDNVQFKKRYFENRNRIRTERGSQWITVPVLTKGCYHQKINEVIIDNEQNWRRKYLSTVRHTYAKARYLGEYIDELEKIIQQGFERLVDLNLALIEWGRERLVIRRPTILASQIREYKERGSDLILAICKDLGAKVYISGPNGRKYLELDSFGKENIKVIYHDYEHPVYQQLHQSFLSHMSIIDILMNHGRDSIQYIKGQD